MKSVYENNSLNWIRGAKRLPGLFTTVKWRNADGGNIPLPDATPLEHYKRAGANINWHEWLDESPSPSSPEVKSQSVEQDEYENWERFKKLWADPDITMDEIKKQYLLTKK